MAPSPKKTPAVAELVLVSLKHCLVNLPQSLVSILEASDISAQDVVVEILVKDSATPNKEGKAAQRSIFVGWSGMPTVRRSTPLPAGRSERGLTARETETASVEIDTTFARMLGLADGQRAGLLLHPDPPLAHTVNIEPLTPGDWEIIELHANFLELNLLSQIRALPNPSFAASHSVQVRQTHPLTLHLSPTSTANIIVSSLVPPLASSVPFAKLAPDAEVIVAPKMRPRTTQQNGGQSITSIGRKSAGGRSGKSGASHRKVSEEEKSKRTLLLRPCDRKFCPNLFDDDEDEDQRNVDLRIWVDPDHLEDRIWRGVTHVVVSIIRPARIEPVLDQNQQQKRRDLESSEAGKPASSVVARLLPLYNAADSIHAVLSTTLCSSLMADGIVGGMVKVEVAPPPVSNSAIRNLLVVPFKSSHEQVNESIKFGGDSQAARQQSGERLRQIFGDPISGRNLLDGPLTDGLFLSPTEETASHADWQGGFVRFAPPLKRSDPQTSWIEGSALKSNIEFGNETVNPFQQSVSSTDKGAETLPDHETPMIGVEQLSEQLLPQLSHSSSVLLTGGLGSGKTAIAQLLGQRLRSEYQTHVSYVSCRRLTIDEVRMSMIKSTFDRQFMAASWAVRLGGQAVVIVDDIDKLCPAETELQTQDNGRSRQISEIICNTVREYCKSHSRVTVLATAQGKEALNSLLVGSNLFKEIVTLKAPNKDQRRKLLQALVGEIYAEHHTTNGIEEHLLNENGADQAAWMDGSEPASPFSLRNETLTINHLDLLEIAGQTDGYMPADLALLVSRAKSEALIRTVSSSQDHSSGADLNIIKEDFESALKGFTPASLRNVSLQTSKTTFDSIGGLQATRKILLETLQYPTLYAPIFAQCSLRLRSGILLYGYPGCGKTLLASAVAGECGLNFISVKGPEILNKYIGASEKSVRDLFERAESARPCVLFFDEFDSIAPKRGHDSTGVTDRVVNQLLTQMDGAEGLSGVYVLAATSRPDLIDPALLRPGRLDKSILCDLPDFDDRLDILKAISKNLRTSPELLTSQRHGLFEVARRTEGYSGADLQAVVYNAHLEAIHDQLGDHSVDGQRTKGGKPQRSSAAKPDILQFRFGIEADAAVRSTSVSHAKQLVEYNAVVAKLEDLRRMRRLERQQRRETSSQVTEDLTPSGRDRGKERQEVVIQWRHIEASLATARSSISVQERERLKRFYREFVVGRNGEMPNGEGSTEVGGRSSLM
ncbi:MAG: hypothetical protein L6R40_004275 [Gallowayella cf. fulva]|nr:MAG: hypothetical protein L6R40_004275 [Xanthomendoza cf. fulva]